MIITSIQPAVDAQGQHETYHNQQYNTLYYKFVVTLDNGKTGKINSKSQQTRFSVGDEVIPQYNDQGYIKKIEKPDTGGNSGGGSAPASNGGGRNSDPSFQLSSCYKYAVLVCKARSHFDLASVKQIAEYFNGSIDSAADKKLMSICLSYSVELLGETDIKLEAIVAYAREMVIAIQSGLQPAPVAPVAVTQGAPMPHIQTSVAPPAAPVNVNPIVPPAANVHVEGSAPKMPWE
jgi:hypothetical protein